MYRLIFRRTAVICGSVVSASSIDLVNISSVNDSPTELPQKNVGWENVKRVFSMDQYGSLSPEVTNILNCTFLTSFVGALYGGFIHSRDAYMKFIESNQASSFATPFEAKRKLQDKVTLAFGRGALKWSPRMAAFCCLYLTFSTCFHAYHGELRIRHFAFAGLCAGAIYRINMGPRGMIAGGTLGCMLGVFAGTASYYLMKLTGSSLSDVERWSAEMYQSRERHMIEIVKKREDAEFLEHNPLIKGHDKRLEGEGHKEF